MGEITNRKETDMSKGTNNEWLGTGIEVKWGQLQGDRELSTGYDFVTIYHTGSGNALRVEMSSTSPLREDCPFCDSFLDEYVDGWKCESCDNEFARLPPELGNDLPIEVGMRVVEVDDKGRRECCGIAPIQGGQVIDVDDSDGVSVKMDDGSIVEFETYQVRNVATARVSVGRDTTPLPELEIPAAGTTPLDVTPLTIPTHKTGMDALWDEIAAIKSAHKAAFESLSLEVDKLKVRVDALERRTS